MTEWYIMMTSKSFTSGKRRNPSLNFLLTRFLNYHRKNKIWYQDKNLKQNIKKKKDDTASDKSRYADYWQETWVVGVPCGLLKYWFISTLNKIRACPILREHIHYVNQSHKWKTLFDNSYHSYELRNLNLNLHNLNKWCVLDT